MRRGVGLLLLMARPSGCQRPWSRSRWSRVSEVASRRVRRVGTLGLRTLRGELLSRFSFINLQDKTGNVGRPRTEPRLPCTLNVGPGPHVPRAREPSLVPSLVPWISLRGLRNTSESQHLSEAAAPAVQTYFTHSADCECDPFAARRAGLFLPTTSFLVMRFSSFLVVLQKGLGFSCLQWGPGFKSGKSHPGRTLRSRRKDQKSRKDESKRSMRPEGCRGQLAEFRPLVLEGWHVA